MKSKAKEFETRTAEKIKELKSDGEKISGEVKKGVAHLWANVKIEYKKMASLFKGKK